MHNSESRQQRDSSKKTVVRQVFIKQFKEGDVMHLPVKLGVQSMVIVNDFELIKEILCKKECLFRPRTWVFKDVGGIASLNGKAWQENRRYCVKTLRELSSGRKSMLEQVREEFQYLREKVSETKGHPVMVRPFLLPCVTNNIAALLLGSRYDFNDPRLNRLDTLLEAFLRIFSGVSPVDPLPKCLKWIAPYIHCLGGGNGLELQQKFFKFIRNEINDRLETVDSDINPHFIKGYLALVTQHNENPKSNINARALHGNMVDILVAGSASVAASILYILLYCAEKPDTVQAKIQEEIDRVVGSGRTPTWEDHRFMPYSMAVVWEMSRWKTLTTLDLPREVDEDVFLSGYVIPKGTIVVANFWAAHFDPKYWKNPEEFDPSRFMTPDGSALLPRPEFLIPFSIGKRMCPGGALATIQIFLCVTTLLQAFRVLPEEGASYSVGSDLFADLLMQGLCFVPRMPE
ncbi:cytochrome P450 2J2 [Ixodes scapularis]|uniref:cytochrome P450 2J2 n=1 Tax=Ixodes scapularis TaxID=6945 RepID=UPI001C3896DA|nr:cytochrome P450 2J2 [Ixodes scapularis]